MTDYHTVKGTLQDDKGTWAVRGYVYDPISGKKKQRSKSTGYKVKDNTKRKAERKMREILAQWEAEANAGTPQCALSVSDCINAWLVGREGKVKESTLMGYRDNANHHVIPAIGEIQAKDLTALDIQSFYDRLQKENGLSAETIRKINVVVRGGLTYAIKAGAIQYNVCADIELPKRTKFRGKVYNKQEINRLMQIAKEAGEPMRAAIMLGLCYGLRREEVCGLRWSSIDFEKKSLTIRDTVTLYRNKRFESDETKTPAGERTIALLPFLIPYLKELRTAQEEAGLTMDRVCVWPDGRELRPDYITHRFAVLLERSGLRRIRYHDLRGTAASVLAPHVKPIQLKEFMGHESIQTTMKYYAQLLDEDKIATSVAMDEALKTSFVHSENYSEQ